MARRIEVDHDYVWRALITYTWPNGQTVTEACGLFNRRSHATASIAQATKGWHSDVTITSVVQRSPLAWETVAPK